MEQGWQCGECGTVYSPYKSKCDHFHGKVVTATTRFEKIDYVFIGRTTDA